MYIITTSYIPNTKLPSNSAISRVGTFGYSFTNNPNKPISSLSNYKTSIFISKYLTGLSDYSSLSQTACMAAYLLNSEEWKDFKNENYAIEAIGAPTAQLFDKSIRNKYPNQMSSKILQCDGVGYFYLNGSQYYDVQLGVQSDTLYALLEKPSGITAGNGHWALASPTHTSHQTSWLPGPYDLNNGNGIVYDVASVRTWYIE